MLEAIYSGGQTGADRGGLDAAIVLGISHGGFCPKNRHAEDGSVPLMYNLTETNSHGYRERTELNVVHTDGTVIVRKQNISPGSDLTRRLCHKHDKPYIEIIFGSGMDMSANSKRLKSFIKACKIKTLNIAGNRESVSPGIQSYTKQLLIEALDDCRSV